MVPDDALDDRVNRVHVCVHILVLVFYIYVYTLLHLPLCTHKISVPVLPIHSKDHLRYFNAQALLCLNRGSPQIPSAFISFPTFYPKI